MPLRFQQSRTKGWRKPNADARCVSRSSRWGNPFDWQQLGRAKAVELHRAALLGDRAEAMRVLGYTRDDCQRELRGRDLGCFCALDQPCHADTLLEVANASA